MRYSTALLTVVLASGTSLTALAEPSPTNARSSAVTATGSSQRAVDAKTGDSNNQRTPPSAPPATSYNGSMTGSVLGVDRHAHIVTVKVDHYVDDIHAGDPIRLDKTAITHKTTRRRHLIHHKPRTASTHITPLHRAPAAAPGETTALPASSAPPATNVSPPNIGGNPIEDNNVTGTATLPPTSPSAAAPASASTSGETTAPSASDIPLELGLGPRRNGGYVPGSTTPGSL